MPVWLVLLVLLWLVSAAIERRLRRPVFEGGAKRVNFILRVAV